MRHLENTEGSAQSVSETNWPPSLLQMSISKLPHKSVVLLWPVAPVGNAYRILKQQHQVDGE